jgi:alcohol dehydrogenase class IV
MDALCKRPNAVIGESAVSRFFLPEIICGHGALAEIGPTARRLGGRRVFLLTEPAVVDSGWIALLRGHLRQSDIRCVLWDAVAPGPQERDVRAALDAYHRRGCDVIVGAGGRAALNAAKAVAVLSTGTGTVADYDGYDRVTQLTPPLVMVPTTVGSGAGVLPSCTVRDSHRRRTVMMLGCALMADVALVDPRTVATLSPDLAAAAGFDALAMALEGYLSPTACPMTDLHALAALRLLGEHLVPSVDALDDADEAAALVMAGVHAGVAFTTTLHSTTDALSRALGEALDVATGAVKAMLLPHVIRCATATRPGRYPAIAEAVGLDNACASDESAAYAVADWARTLADKVGIPASLSDIGITPDVADRAVVDALCDAEAAAALHPSSREDAASLLRAAW